MFRILIILLVCLSSFGFVFLKTDTPDRPVVAENCPGHFQLSTFSGKGLGTGNDKHRENQANKLENC